MEDRFTRIDDCIEKIKDQIFSGKVDITEVMTSEGIKCKKVPYGHRNELLKDCTDWDDFEAGSVWGEPDGHELFRVTVIVPEKFSGKEVFFFLSTGAEDIWNTDNPQMLVYINGSRRSGMDMNHNSISIYKAEDWKKRTDRTVDIAIYAYSNLSVNGNYLRMELGACDEAAKAAYFDMSVPFDGVKAMLGLDSRKTAIDLLSDKTALSSAEPVDSDNAEYILTILDKACDILQQEGESDTRGNFSKELLEEVSAFLADNLYGIRTAEATVASIGHTHIDVAWKWPVRQTREKAIRSYSTVMELMKRYPEYLFMASSPQTYEFVREDEPELFEEILARVKEGRFEPEGAMWLEADCNLISGESLVRQILYGKRYFKEMFGVDSDILWLPDVFGYSKAMPQILQKSGVRAFVTTKLAWNDTNRLPHDLFMWKGIDGSLIPVYIVTTCDLPLADKAMKDGGILNYTYNGRQDASQVMGTWRAFREKNITNETLTCYGFGDGGGGPTWEMLETDRRLRRGIPGCPKTVQKSVSAFMDGLLDKVRRSNDVPVWDDELYLEFHRGTYTSIGKNKKYNRRLEILLQEAETLSVLAHIYTGLSYPKKELYEAWKILMLNQFHDILPGSSIEEVYITSEENYKKAIDIVTELINSASDKLSEASIWKKTDLLPCESDNDTAQNPRETLVAIKENVTVIETDYYTISFDRNGEIVSLVDKEAGREVRDMGQSPLNRLIAFKDEPKEYDAWNIDADFERISWDITDIEEMKICGYLTDGTTSEIDIANWSEDTSAKFVEVHVDIKRTFRDSQICQSIVIKNDSRRIDFRTTADWHEHQILLKAAFPVDVTSKEITCEIQFGNIRRNLTRDTSWDRAKFECCTHRWMDISDERSGYGVAVLNDCKYGYDAKEKLMRLTLIKSGIYPNPNADQGIHEFTYSLLPHKGDYREGYVIEEATRLNLDSHMFLSHDISAGSAGRAYESMMNSVIDLKGEKGVYISSVKQAEESEDIVIRLYEGFGQEHKVSAGLLKGLDKPVKDVYECDLMENKLSAEMISYDLTKRLISMEFKPFEIKTIRISL